MKFEEYEAQEYFGFELPTVWMRTTNLPKVLRTYEVLWVISTMFGASQRVDMITTRKSNFGRFKVAVLDPALVPNRMDCVIGTRFFELNFEVEPYDPALNRSIFDKRDNPDNDDQGKGDNEQLEDNNKKQC